MCVSVVGDVSLRCVFVAAGAGSASCFIQVFRSWFVVDFPLLVWFWEKFPKIFSCHIVLIFSGIDKCWKNSCKIIWLNLLYLIKIVVPLQQKPIRIGQVDEPQPWQLDVRPTQDLAVGNSDCSLTYWLAHTDNWKQATFLTCTIMFCAPWMRTQGTN